MAHTSSDLRVGGIAAIAGGIGGLVANVLHPTPPAETEALLRLHGVSTGLQFTLPVPVWPLGAAVDSFWLVTVGVVMLRKST